MIGISDAPCWKTQASHKGAIWEQEGKLAAIQCLNKCLLYNYVWLTHIPLAICSNDDKSCYDHIVLMVAALCLCRLGAPKAAVQRMVSTIHSMQHHVWSSCLQQFDILAGKVSVGSTNSWDQPGQWCWSSNLGHSQFAKLSDTNRRRLLSSGYINNILTY